MCVYVLCTSICKYVKYLLTYQMDGCVHRTSRTYYNTILHTLWRGGILLTGSQESRMAWHMGMQHASLVVQGEVSRQPA